MARLLSLASLVLLCACSQEQDIYSGADAYDEAIAAQEQIAFLEDRVAQLEREAEDREAANSRLVDATISDLSTLSSEVNRLSANERVWREHIDYLRSYHGLAPM